MSSSEPRLSSRSIPFRSSRPAASVIMGGMVTQYTLSCKIYYVTILVTLEAIVERMFKFRVAWSFVARAIRGCLKTRDPLLTLMWGRGIARHRPVPSSYFPEPFRLGPVHSLDHQSLKGRNKGLGRCNCRITSLDLGSCYLGRGRCPVPT